LSDIEKTDLTGDGLDR